ncbi:MAG TPA: class I adenylate-forming enzyme family protein [Longimicrobiales bacterium]|nr:class I adenylate-forming enzyme family protein [Longimicrobiales bacterium]
MTRRAQTIGELFQLAVARHADREAIIFRELTWSYAELAAHVNAACQLLPALAQGRLQRVAIIGANHPGYVVGYFAAQLLGAATIEIGRDETLDGVLATLAASQADVILTDRPDILAAARIPAIGFEPFLERCAQMRSTPADHDEADRQRPELASIVYTSGTTGAPKGVMLSHANVLFVVYAVCEYLELSAADRYALVLPMAHTYGKSNLLSCVASGAAVVFVENPQNSAAFYGWMMRQRCTVLSVVPFHLNVLARMGIPDGIDLGSLRAITTSGGPLPESAVRAVEELLPGAWLYSMYGLTESSTRVTYLPPELLMSKRGSVGRALPGVSVEIRNAEGDALPPGVVGHVYVAGPNVMQGYLGDPELTAQTLVDGWLNTGDVGYVDSDGCLFLTGREKEIIKVAGERISPAEIEEVLLRHPAVAEAAAVGVPDALLGETVWAYVKGSADIVDFGDIAAFCAAHLSAHKVPRRFIETDQIPRTPTGKIRRHLLRSALA